MGKRRTAIGSDDDEDGKQPSTSTAKRSRLETKESPRSKGKGKAREDNDILNDFRVDEDDDMTAIRDAHAEEDEGSQERFEEEHEESIRESIRQRNKQHGVGAFLCLPFHPDAPGHRAQLNLALLNPLRCTILCATSFLPSNSVRKSTSLSVCSIAYYEVSTEPMLLSRSQRKYVDSVNNARCSLTCGVGGKSAVLTAITVALGGKATATGRGNGLRSFIREGQPYVLFSPDRIIFGDECD